MHTKLTLARELAACLGGIEIRLVSGDDDVASELIRETFYGSLFPAVADRSIESYLAKLKPGCVYFFSGILGLSYIAIRTAGKSRYLIAGPCRSEDFSESRVRTGLRPYHVSDSLLQQVLSYCRWQPVLSPEKFHQLGILLGRHVLDLPEPIDYQNVEYHWSRNQPQEFMPAEPYVDHSRIRQIEMRYEASAALTEAVKQGNLSLALRMIQGIRTDAASMMRNPDPLRNAQNLCIVMNTQLRHAMEERKIHPYRLDMLSTGIARKIEALKSLDEVKQFFAQIIRQYCELALEKNYAHLEPFSRQAVIYIMTHLTDNLTVKHTANALMVNANYLSGRFHRDVGMTFTDFVNRQRTEQAASLLQRTNMQVQQVAAAVGYNNTSYFTKQFVRFHGVTPRQHRSAGQP